ncbi:TPA: hypothetical protein EYP37_05425 [Candidatus Poribacteria bacterium]|nr:hypothetical protein [Candidatus Poribacteria bacterium]
MILQFTENMPGIEHSKRRTYFDTTKSSFNDKLIEFHSAYFAVTEGDDGHLERFGLSEGYASGMHVLMEVLSSLDLKPVMVKGQLTGPFTLGTSLTDRGRRSAYYDPQLRDVMVKYLAMKAGWQLRKLSDFSSAFIFIDESGMAAFGSSLFLSISEGDILKDIGEVIDTIHTEKEDDHG